MKGGSSGQYVGQDFWNIRHRDKGYHLYGIIGTQISAYEDKNKTKPNLL